jgi:hypothetical protein
MTGCDVDGTNIHQCMLDAFGDVASATTMKALGMFGQEGQGEVAYNGEFEGEAPEAGEYTHRNCLQLTPLG